MHRIVLAGGGTAGHVNPLLAVANAIRAKDPSADIAVIGTAVGLERDLVPQAGFELETIEKVPFPRRPNMAALRFPMAWKRETARTRQILERHQAQVVVGFGGYASAPVYASAHAHADPDSDPRAERARRHGQQAGRPLGRLHRHRIRGNGAEGASGCRDRTGGAPVAAAIAQLCERLESDREGARRQAAEQLGLDANRPVVVVTGGSLGAANINRAVAASASSLLRHAQIVHLTGNGKADEVRELVSVSAGDAAVTGLDASHAGDGDYHVAEYLERIDLAFRLRRPGDLPFRRGAR